MDSLLSLITKVGHFLFDQRLKVLAVLQILARSWYKLAVTALLFCAGIGLLIAYVVRSERYEAVVGKVLDASDLTENQTALTSLLLSGIEGDVVTQLKSERLDSSFEEAWNQLVQDVGHTIPKDESVYLASGSPGSLTLTETSKPSDSPNKEKNPYPGFLFAPYYLVVPPPKADAERRVVDDATIEIVRESEINDGIKPRETESAVKISSPSLYSQIILSRMFAGDMQRLAGIPMVSKNSPEANLLAAIPVQSYAIMSGGITRVFIHDDPHPTKFFSKQFPSTTFFPSRPYFWPTLVDHPNFYSHIIPTGEPDKQDAHTSENITSRNSSQVGSVDPNLFSSGFGAQTTVGEFFRVSHPYLDLGGSGIVVTLTRGLVIDGVGKVVICIDLRFDDEQGVNALLKKTIGSLSGKIYKLDCAVGQASEHLNCDTGDSLPPVEDELFHRVKNQFLRAPTEVLSNLYRFDSGSTIKFSLPLDRTINQDGSQRLTLMLASFDPKHYKFISTLIAFGAASAFGLFTAFLAYLWGSLEVGLVRYSQALDKVDAVMGYCPTPYLRLRSDDTIVAANNAFKSVFLPANISAEALREITLKSLCVDEASQKQYDKVEEGRRQGAAVEPYELNLRTADSHVVRVKVFAAAIPAEVRNTIPSTFGILLPEVSAS